MLRRTFLVLLLVLGLSGTGVLASHVPGSHVETGLFWGCFDGNGDIIPSASGSTGYGGGAWIEYPVYNWWNVWFPNEWDPFSPKVIEILLTDVTPVPGVPWDLTVTINYTRGWTDPTRPPIPGLDPDPDLYIVRDPVDGLPVLPTAGEWLRYKIVIPYCPPWVSVDIRGTNVWFRGQITHECLDIPTPAAASGGLALLGVLGLLGGRRMRGIAV